MVAELVACAVALLVLAAEVLHAQRARHVAVLAFGAGGRPALWTRAVPLFRAAALGGLCWGLTTLLLLEPKTHRTDEIPENELRHLLLVLDVSPSMRLEDAGPNGKEPRRKRAADLLQSFFERVPMELYRTSVVAVYNGAKPVVVDTRDLEIIRNILTELPMQYAFPAGGTDLFAGLEEAARMAKPWRPGTATLVVVSDGDTVPATGMPKLPVSVAHVVIVGVGDPQGGRFIDGHQSRQDVSTLRQVAARLGGAYHNGNEKHLPTDMLRQVTISGREGKLARLTKREYALLACAAGAIVLVLLPLALHFAGTRWRPGTPIRKVNTPGGQVESRNSLSRSLTSMT
jgi:Ca-activated chloride channel family protein